MFKQSLDMVFTREMRDEEKRTKDPSRGNKYHEQRPAGMKVYSMFREGAASSMAGFEGRSLGTSGKDMSSVSGFLYLRPHRLHSDHVKSILDGLGRHFREHLS